METKHRKGDFLVLRAAKEIEFPNPVAVFANNPYAYTGTRWKLENISNTWNGVTASNSWKKAAKKLNISSEFVVPRQIAVPADEPDHLLEQEDLVLGKTVNQIKVLMQQLESPNSKVEGEVIIPQSIIEMFAQGFLSIAFINTDVGNMHHIGPGKYYPLRNFYASKKYLLKEREAKLAKRLDHYWRETYPDKKGSGYSRVIESGATLTQIIWSRDSNMTYSRIFPGVSTVGILMEESILSHKKGRENALQFLHEKYLEKDKHRINGHNPFAEMNGRAGGMKTEDYVQLALALGIGVEILARGSTIEEQMSSLMEHVEGPPFALIQQLILTLANTSNCELHNVEGARSSGPRLYPPGKRGLLTL